MSGPRVVVFGGGHGGAAALRAARDYAGDVTGVITVADDGGSSGRLRSALDVVAVGDLRRCLLALAQPGGPWDALFEHRFSAGTLEGHAVGNLVLAGLIEIHGDLVTALDEAAEMLGCVGRVLPATSEPVELCARVADGVVTGQSAINHRADIDVVVLEPQAPQVPGEVLAAVAEADHLVIGPGSLFTSVLASLIPPRILEAVSAASARKIYVANLREQIPETLGRSLEDHLTALRRHGVYPDVVVFDPALGLKRGLVDIPVIEAPLSFDERPMHDPVRLAGVLSTLA
jgi:uncharacterized cofD-like protein